jgi:hypothetical protein
VILCIEEVRVVGELRRRRNSEEVPEFLLRLSSPTTLTSAIFKERNSAPSPWSEEGGVTV